MAINLEKYRGKNIHIVGVAGAEGSAIADFLCGNVECQITAHDFSRDKEEFKNNFFKTHLSINSTNRKTELDKLMSLPIKIFLRDEYLKNIKEADIVFVSQVWFKYPQNLPVLKDLYDKGVEFKTITNLYFELAPCSIISVTGTNGKTTTSNLIKNILSLWEKDNSGGKFYFAGNDRMNLQVLNDLKNMEKDDVLLLETSSTQLLLNSKISPHIGVITNITPNHLDDHGSFENYVSAKESLIQYQKDGDFAVLNFDNESTYEIAQKYPERSFLFSTKKELDKGCFLKGEEIFIRNGEKEEKIFDRGDLHILGEANLQNALAASMASYLFGVKPDIIAQGVTSYVGIKHRLKLIYRIDDISYIDDTQSTTPEAAIAGINSFEGDIVLFMGGDNKGMDYEKMAKIINSKVKTVFLFSSEVSDEIEKKIDNSIVEIEKVNDMSEAMELLKNYIAKNKIVSGDTVLISPGAAHFYSKFVESSGKNLKLWIKEIKRK